MQYYSGELSTTGPGLPFGISGIYYEPLDCNSGLYTSNIKCSFTGTCKFGCVVCQDGTFIGLYDATCSPIAATLGSGDHLDVNGTAYIFSPNNAEFSQCTADTTEPGGLSPPPSPPTPPTPVQVPYNGYKICPNNDQLNRA